MKRQPRVPRPLSVIASSFVSGTSVMELLVIYRISIPMIEEELRHTIKVLHGDGCSCQARGKRGAKA
jgi:hypothetical protein